MTRLNLDYRCLLGGVLSVVDRLYDRLLGMNTNGIWNVPEDLDAHSDAVFYVASRYRQLAAMTKALRLTEDDVFADIGCGKGRALLYVAKYTKVGRAVGIELVPELADIAERNAARLGLSDRVEVRVGDAAHCCVDDATAYYLYHPFGEATLSEFLIRVRASLNARPRQIAIVYHNPVHGDLLDRTEWLTPMGRIDRMSLWIWRNRPLVYDYPPVGTVNYG